MSELKTLMLACVRLVLVSAPIEGQTEDTTDFALDWRSRMEPEVCGCHGGAWMARVHGDIGEPDRGPAVGYGATELDAAKDLLAKLRVRVSRIADAHKDALASSLVEVPAAK